jgi:hypothetical protein
MKLRVAFAIAVALLALPLAAQTVYDNGPINGTTDAWTINFGFAVSDSFTIPTQSGVTGLSFGAWVFPGDVLQSAEVLVGTSEFSGDLSDQVVNFTQSNCSGNQYGFNVCVESGSLGTALNLSPGTYWLTLENATVNTGDPIYWDENSGPSSASENSVGTIPSEAFTLLGMAGSTTTSWFGTPEPNMVLLLCSGLLGAGAMLRRRLF